MMADSISILIDWSRSGKISQVSFGDDGALTLGDVSLSAADSVQVVGTGDNNKTCNYTIGSIVLQLLDVNQSLLAYRKACKKHKVKDAIKVSDKAEIIAFFKGGAAAPDSGAKAATAETTTSEITAKSTGAASSQPPTRDRKKEQRSSSEREKDRQHRSKDSSSSKKTKPIQNTKFLLSSSLLGSQREGAQGH